MVHTLVHGSRNHVVYQLLVGFLRFSIPEGPGILSLLSFALLVALSSADESEDLNC